MKYELTGKIWKYTGNAAWYFITIPPEYTDDIKAMQNPLAKNFGSVRVIATIGPTSWATSVFPDTKSGSFLLPIKKEIRIRHDLKENQEIKFTLEIQDLDQ